MKFLQSGGYIPPFTQYDAIQSATEAPKSKPKEEDSDKRDKTDSDDILKLLNDLDGLPSDVQAIATEIQKYYRTSNLFDSGELDTSIIANRYLQNISKIKIANFNKKEYDEAKKEVMAKGGLKEPAITEQGLLAVATKDGIQQVSVEEYLENPKDYTLLTNSQLLSYRAESVPFDNSILRVVENGIGTEEVNKLIKNSINNLGSSEISQAGYTRIDQQRIAEGVKLLQTAAANGYDVNNLGVDGLYKINYLNKDQAQQAQQALSYAWNMLPLNAKTLLKLRSGSEEEAIKLVGSYIVSGINDTYQFDTNILTTKEGKIISGTKHDDDLPDTLMAERWLLGDGKETSILINGGTEYAALINGKVMPITNAKDEPLGVDTLEAAHKGSYSGILDWNNVYFGDTRIDPQAMDKVILYDGNIYKTEFPAIRDDKGNIKPNLKFSEDYEKAEEYIRANNITDYNKINEVYAENNLPTKYDENGNVKYENYATFGIMTADAFDIAFDNKKTTPEYAERIKSKTRLDNIIENYYQLTKYDKNGIEVSRKGLSSNKIYEGVLYIPVIDNVPNAKLGQLYDPSERANINNAQKASDLARSAQQQIKLVSYNNGE